MRIWRAQQRVMSFSTGRFGLLNLTDKAMLCEILRSVQQLRPAEPFSVRRSTLEARLGISPATATRWLVRLRVQGWFERDQVLSRAHGFQVSTMKLTEEAITALALRQPASLFLRESPVSHPEESSEQSSSKRQSADAGGLPIASNPESPCTSAEADTDGKAQGLGPMDANAANAGGQELRGHPVTPTIPEALQSLMGMLSAVQICFLMRRSRAHGHRLEDVVTPCLKSIRAADRPLAYILRLLRLPRDWAGVRQRMEAQGVTMEHAHPIALVERREGEERQEFARRAARARAVEIQSMKAALLQSHAGQHFAASDAVEHGHSDMVWCVRNWGIERLWRANGALCVAMEPDSGAFLRSFGTRLVPVSELAARALLGATECRQDDGSDAGSSTIGAAPDTARQRAKAALSAVRHRLKASRFG